MLKDLTGLDNGFLRIVSFKGMAEKDRYGKRKQLWNALCRCLKDVIISTAQFNEKQPKSCGCYKQQRRGNKSNHDYHITHGMSHKHPLYRTWRNMRQRCYNKNNPDFIYYGGKLIKLCEEWHNDFKSFMDWGLKHGWKKLLVIDRIDSNKDYSPTNCRFITPSENSKRIIFPRGSKCSSAILNEGKVIEIKKRISNGERNYLIAQDYNINSNVVYQIKTGKTWKHVL